jgi:membrane associated rhomboid family serine protease
MPENRCDICSVYDLLPFKCKYCGGTFCAMHRLPENHQCAGLGMLKQRPFVDTKAVSGKRKAMKIPTLALPYPGHYAYILIGITVIVFMLQAMLNPWLTNFFSLSMGALLTRPWGPVTSIFLHGSILHLFFNMLALFFFGPILEQRIGSKSFLGLYFGGGILAGLAQVVMFPQYPVIGASGAIFCVLGALTVLMPHMVIYLYFVPLKMVYITVLFAILDLYPVLTGSGDGVAHIAHLTGLAIGLVAGYWYREKSRVRNARWQV